MKIQPIIAVLSVEMRNLERKKSFLSYTHLAFWREWFKRDPTQWVCERPKYPPFTGWLGFPSISTDWKLRVRIHLLSSTWRLFVSFLDCSTLPYSVTGLFKQKKCQHPIQSEPARSRETNLLESRDILSSINSNLATALTVIVACVKLSFSTATNTLQ